MDKIMTKNFQRGTYCRGGVGVRTGRGWKGNERERKGGRENGCREKGSRGKWYEARFPNEAYVHTYTSGQATADTFTNHSTFAQCRHIRQMSTHFTITIRSTIPFLSRSSCLWGNKGFRMLIEGGVVKRKGLKGVSNLGNVNEGISKRGSQTTARIAYACRPRIAKD